MAEKVSRGQADKAAAEQRTAEVDAENKQQDEQQRRESDPATTSGDQVDGKADANSAAERLATADPNTAMDVAVDPYPPYEDKSIDDLRTAAENRGVEINRDVEKAELVSRIRAKDPTNAALDFMPLDDLRALARERDVQLDEEFEKAHLITELRAADTGVGGTGQGVR